MVTPVPRTTPRRSKLLGRVSDVAVLVTNKQKIPTTESTCLFLGHGSVNVVVWSVICCHGSGGRYYPKAHRQKSISVTILTGTALRTPRLWCHTSRGARRRRGFSPELLRATTS